MSKFFSLDGPSGSIGDKRSISVKSYKIDIDPIRQLRTKKNKRKIILKIKFLHFPSLDSADLQIYPASRKGGDGTNEKPIIVPPYSPAPALSSYALIVGNSHVDLKKIFQNIKKKDIGYFLFTPVLSSEFPDNLVFNVRVHIDRRLDEIDFGDSNPSPPAPPGGSVKKKKKV